jgi:hypothetical protein
MELCSRNYHGVGVRSNNRGIRRSDDIIAPALRLMRKEKELDHISQDNQQFILDTTRELIVELGSKSAIAGINMSHQEAYRTMVGRGFRTDLIGVAMQEGNDSGYKRSGLYMLDDWR